MSERNRHSNRNQDTQSYVQEPQGRMQTSPRPIPIDSYDQSDYADYQHEQNNPQMIYSYQPPPMQQPINVYVNNTNTNTNENMNINGYGMGGVSLFDGKLSQYIGWSILGCLLTIFTFGICFPWAICMVYKWKIGHTLIGGRRLYFNGKAIGLLGNWLLWLLLTIVTLGIYSFWLNIKLEQWKVKNTTFAN